MRILPAGPWCWPWPMPAVAGWLAAWSAFAAARPVVGAASATALAVGVGALAAWPLRGVWRRTLVGLGFPLSALASGAAAGLPAWAWLLPMALLGAAYPLRAWRDAPFFPTPAGALDALAESLPLPPGARVIDAGCGLGHGLRALRRGWPQARIEGVEWSWPLALASSLRCPWARVARDDMWAASWRGAALVYVFQRPESMARAWAKACAELAPGAWLVSLEFGLPGRPADRSAPAGRRRVHAWRVPASEGAGLCAPPAAGAPASGLNPRPGVPISPEHARASEARA